MSKRNNKAMLLTSASVATLLMCFSHAEAAFINEIHYENSGADIGEAVELFAEVSTDFSGWSLLFYNGAGGAVYETIDLSSFGVSTGAIFINPPSFQNGVDGIALVDNTSTVLQFLSYEGAFIATDGPASGLLSLDIGVAESAADIPGLSLQLQGTGSNYNDFTWSGPLASTFGSINTGQILAPVPVPAAVWLFGSGLLGLTTVARRKKS
ncbi:VPLPA-CTERM sorting domain-containing protein [Pseudomonadota bacterium]